MVTIQQCIILFKISTILTIAILYDFHDMRFLIYKH